MTEAVMTPTKGPQQTRYTPIKRATKKDKEERIDPEQIIKDWKRKTNIVDRIKKSDPDKPFYVDITPDMALDLLSLNDANQNRDLDWQAIGVYKKQMLIKRWKEHNGDTIRITKSLKLIDGQHKLWAIYLSGQTISFLIVTGLDEDAFSYIDIGRKRNAKDITAIKGYKTNSGQLSQVVKLILLYKNKSIVKGTVTDKDVLNHEVNDFEDNRTVMGRLIKDLDYAKARWMTFNATFMTPPQWVFVYYLFRSLPGMEDKAKFFMDRFADSVDLKANSPIKIVRQYFENEFKHLDKKNVKRRSNKASFTTKVKHLIEAWNSFVRNEKVTQIKADLSNEMIPKPIFRQND